MTVSTLLSLLLLFSSSGVLAEIPIKSFGTGSSNKAGQFLTAEQAFQLRVDSKAQELQLHFIIAPNYYLYKDRFKFEVNQGTAILGQAFFSAEPEWKDDAEFGRVEVFHQSLTVTVPVKGNGDILVRWQGCADAGLCYAPQEQLVSIGASALTQKAALLKPTTRDAVMSIPIPTLIPLVSYEVVEEQESTTDNPQPDANNELNQNQATLILPQSNLSSTPAPVSTPNTTDDGFKLADNPLLALFTLYALGIGLALRPVYYPCCQLLPTLLRANMRVLPNKAFF